MLPFMCKFPALSFFKELSILFVNTCNTNSSKRALRPTINEKTSILELLQLLSNVTNGNALSLFKEKRAKTREEQQFVATHNNPDPPQPWQHVSIASSTTTFDWQKHKVYALWSWVTICRSEGLRGRWALLPDAAMALWAPLPLPPPSHMSLFDCMSVCRSYRPCSSTEDEEEVLLELTNIRKTEKEAQRKAWFSSYDPFWWWW